MTMFVLPSLVVAALLLAAFGVRFYRRQNAGALGGRISRAKAYWLPFAIYAWFVVAPLFGCSPAIHKTLSATLLGFSIFMWLRGLVEMTMLYFWKNWRPPYGIGHDIACIMVLLVGTGIYVASAPVIRGADALALTFIAVLLVSLVVEIHHAVRFFVAVRGMTTGADGVWFADDEIAIFRRINHITFIWNIILSLTLVLLIAGAFMLQLWHAPVSPSLSTPTPMESTP